MKIQSYELTAEDIGRPLYAADRTGIHPVTLTRDPVWGLIISYRQTADSDDRYALYTTEAEAAARVVEIREVLAERRRAQRTYDERACAERDRRRENAAMYREAMDAPEGWDIVLPEGAYDDYVWCLRHDDEF